MKTPTSSSVRSLILTLTRDGQASSTLRLQSPFHIRPRDTRIFSTSRSLSQKNRILTPFRTPPDFHDALRLVSANNTLLVALFTTSACTPCRTITPLLTQLIQTRPASPEDNYSALAFAELELDSPDDSNGRMLDLGVEYGVNSMPTLIGFGGRRAERVTNRIVDTRFLADERKMAEWIDGEMRKGDRFPGGGGEGGTGWLGRLFGT